MSNFVDLAATLRMPRAPDEEDAGALARAAAAGGYAVVVVSARGVPGAPGASGEPVDVDSLAALRQSLEVGARASDSRVRFIPALAPLRSGSDGKRDVADLSDLASMASTLPADVPRVLRLRSAVDDALLLRRIGDLARGLSALVIVPSVDAALMRGAVAVEGAIATRLGLPAVPEASEHIAVSRIIEVTKLTGARFHIAGLFTAGGARAVDDAARAGLPVSGSVFASHLLLDERALLARRYDTRLLARPPLPSQRSREALIDAVKRHALVVSSGHHAVPKRERDLEMTRATPGMTSLSSTATLLSALLSPAELTRALRTGPAAILGIDPGLDLPAPTTMDAALVPDDLYRVADEVRL